MNFLFLIIYLSIIKSLKTNKTLVANYEKELFVFLEIYY